MLDVMVTVHRPPVQTPVRRVHIQRAVHLAVHPVRTSHRIQHTPVQRAIHLHHVHGRVMRDIINRAVHVCLVQLDTIAQRAAQDIQYVQLVHIQQVVRAVVQVAQV